MADYKDYFIYTKICFCKKDLKNFKIFLSYYNESGLCILSDEEKSTNLPLLLSVELSAKWTNLFNSLNSL